MPARDISKSGVENGEELSKSHDKSPYADAEIVSLLIGPDATPYSIHSTLLSQSTVLVAQLDRKNVTKQQISIPELDKATAHVLVHYMYTAQYQELRTSSDTQKSALSSYEDGTCVYCAAVRYQLPGLVDLAKEKITSLDEEVGISDVLAMARDHVFPLLPDDETWYPAYLEGAIRSAMAKDPEPFKSPTFITQVEGNSRLLQIVWKTVVSNYALAPVAPNAGDAVLSPTVKAISDDGDSLDLHDHEKSSASVHELAPPPSVDGSQTTAVTNDIAVDSKVPAKSPESLSSAGVPFEHVLKLDDIEPTVETHKSLEPFTDELGFERSKMYKKMGKRDSDVEAMDSSIGNVPHKRSDSVVQAEDSVKMPMKETDLSTATPVEEIQEAGKIDGTAPLVVNGSTEAANAAKKNKKKSKKKSGTVF